MARPGRRAAGRRRPPRQLRRLQDIRADRGLARHRSGLAAVLAGRHVRGAPGAKLPGDQPGAVTVLLVAAALIAGTGAIAALAPIDARLGLVGLTASLLGATLIADPLPSPAVLGIRLSAALLAVVILRAA